MNDLPNDILTLKALLQELLLRVVALEEKNMLLCADNLELKRENAELRKENAELKKENAALKHRLGLNSNNSHKPPSSDGYTKSPALKKPKGGLRGGQKGHEGHTLKLKPAEEVTSIVYHRASHCSCCGRLFVDSDPSHVLYRRQVFDIPMPRLEVTEHRVVAIFCCGRTNVGSFPAGVSAVTQYGIQLRTLCVLLNTAYRLPFAKISQLVFDLYGYRVSEATLISANEVAYETLAPIEADIKAAILASEVVHFDETGMRVAGELYWFHTACTDLLSYLYVHKSRGKEALEAATGLIKDFKNWAIHDCWASYFSYTHCKHAICNAHILRELTALTENGSNWAADMHRLLLKLYEVSQKGTQITHDKEGWYAKYKAICEAADAEEPQPIKTNKQGKSKNTKGRNLLNRLVMHQDGIMAFAFEIKIPFTNNQAERDIRHVKIKQKVAMSFRTLVGAEIYARIQAFIATTRKQKQNTFEQLCNIMKGGKYAFTT